MHNVLFFDKLSKLILLCGCELLLSAGSMLVCDAAGNNGLLKVVCLTRDQSVCDNVSWARPSEIQILICIYFVKDADGRVFWY